MAGIDKTKQNIGIDKLDEEDRKKLFKDFIAAGGKVDSPTKRTALTIDREKQAEYRSKLDSLQRSKARTSQTMPQQNLDLKQKTNIGIFLKFKIASHLFFGRVTGVDAVFFKDSFFGKLFSDYRSAFDDLQQTYIYVFQVKPSIGNSVTLKLDSEKPLFFELIDMTANLNEKELWGELAENYKTLPKTLSQHRDGFLYLMKKICVLKPYENSILNSYLRALDYYAYYSGDKSKHSEYKHIVKHSLYLIFHKLYYQLYWLTVSYLGQDPKYDFNKLYKLLSISENEKPGSREKNKKTASSMLTEKVSNKVDKESDKDVKDEKADELPDNIKQGILLMSKVNMANLINEFDRDKLFSDINGIDRTDKTFKTFLLFAEFEKEYSFILSSSKIKYNIYFTSSGKINYGKQLQDIFDLMQKPWGAFKDFKSAYHNYSSLSLDKPAGNQQYMAHVNRLKDAEQNKNQISQKARGLVMDFLNELYAILEELQKDLIGDCKLIANPQETLNFDTRIEGTKKLSGVKIFEAINLIAAYVAAFIYRLSRGGDLYGISSESSMLPEIQEASDDQSNVEDSGPAEDSSSSEYLESTEGYNFSESSDPPYSSEVSGSLKDEYSSEEADKEESDSSEESDKPKKSGSDGSIFNELDDLL